MKTHTLSALLFFVFTTVLSAQTAWNIPLDKRNPFEALNIAKPYAKIVGKTFLWENGILKTGESNGMLLTSQTGTTGKYTLTGKSLGTGVISLITHAKETIDSYYILSLNVNKKQLLFSRYFVNEGSSLKHEFPYDGGQDFTLAMEFDGKNIAVSCNGKKIGEWADDLRLLKGHVGISCSYYSAVQLKSLEYTPAANAVGFENQTVIPPYVINENIPRIPTEKFHDVDLGHAYTTVNGTRTTVSLNQYWQFQPVPEFGTAPAADAWGYIIVPGYWAKGAIGCYMRTQEGAATTQWRGLKYHQGGIGAWHRRFFTAPDNWNGKRLTLVIEDVCGKAAVYFGKNGQPLGEAIAVKDNAAINPIIVDITGKINFGAPTELLIATGNAKNTQAGIGNVRIDLAPLAAMGHPAITTSIANKSFSVDFIGCNINEKLLLTIRIADSQNGRELFSKSLPFNSRMTFNWLPPTLWTPDTPALYDISFSLNDAAGNLLDSMNLRYGFRKFEARDGKFWLNGQPFVLKCETALRNKNGIWSLDYLNNPDYLKAQIATYKQLNLNGAYLADVPSEQLLSYADEMGFMFIIAGLSLSHEQMDKNFEKTLAALDKSLQQKRNNPVYSCHPSVIAFLTDVWYNYNAGGTNPAYSGVPEGDPNRSGLHAIREQRLNTITDTYKKYFPDLECFTGGSSLAGNIYATHVYHTWGAPTTELRSFFETWNAKGKHPFFVGESQLPYLGSFYDLKNFGQGCATFVTEQSARIMGPSAYEVSSTTTSRPFHDFTNQGWFWHFTEKKNNGMYGFLPYAPIAVTEQYMREIMPGWKFHGLTGWGNFDYVTVTLASHTTSPSALPFNKDISAPYMKPEGFENGNARRPAEDIRYPENYYDMRPTRLFAPFKHLMQSVSAEFFDRPDDPLLQNHSGYSGDSMTKSIMIFNDAPKALDVNVTLSLVDSQNREQPLPKISAKIAPFEHKLLPFTFELPYTTSRSSWNIRAVITGTPSTITLSFPFQSFAKPALAAHQNVYLYDPEGILTSRLALITPFSRLNSLTTLPNSGLVIIGRNGISQTDTLPNFNAAMAHGLNFLVMEQSPETSPELMKERTRRVFINAPAHPVFDGLADEDFCFWQDALSLAPAKNITPAGVNWSDWGNRNMVASYVFRRPQHGSFISLLVCGFDLFKTPLLEYRAGNGTMIASQLDITPRLETDPAATRLFANMIGYLSRPRQHNAKILFFGSDNGAKFHETFGVDAIRTSTLDAKTLAEAKAVIISDPDWTLLKHYRRELCDFTYWGGTVLYIHKKGTEFNPSWLPFTFSLGEALADKATFHGTPDGFWQNGFGPSELYWHDLLKVPAFVNVPEHFDQTSPAVLARTRFGSGQWIFSTLTDEIFDDQHAPQLGKTIRLYSAIWSSIGAPLQAAPVFFACPKAKNILDFSEQKWEFATDENDIGLKEEWQLGKGSPRWLKGLIADGIEVRVGQSFESFLLKDYNGVCWYRLSFDVPKNILDARTLFFNAGAIDDLDEVYINGVKIGATGEDTPHYWEIKRNYPIPNGLLKPQGNLIVVRVTDLRGDGGIVKGPVMISTSKLEDTARAWESPWPKASERDYTLNPDIIRMY